MLSIYPLTYFAYLAAATAVSALALRVIHNQFAIWAIVTAPSAALIFLSFQQSEAIALAALPAITVINFCLAKLMCSTSASGRFGSAMLLASIALNIFSAACLRAISLPFASIFLINQIVFLSQVHFRRHSPLLLPWISFNLLYPRLVAGPIVGYYSFVRRLGAASIRHRFDGGAEKAIIFIVVGLAKKLLIADRIGTYISPVFDGANSGAVIGGTDAVAAAIGNYLQLYFEFSSVCEIAYGIALLVGVQLPHSFFAPLRATNIRSFWRRWHRTATAFFEVYVFRGLRGSGGAPRDAGAVATGLVLAGCWLVPSVLGVVWGVLQAVALLVDLLARGALSRLSPGIRRATSAPFGILGWAWIFVFMSISSLLLRVKTPEAAVAMLSGLLGQNGFALPLALQHLFPIGISSSIRFTDAPLVPQHSIGLITLSLMVLIGLSLELLLPAMSASTQTHRRRYFVVAVYFVLAEIVQGTIAKSAFTYIYF